MKGAKVRRASVRRMWFSVGDDIACPTKNDPRFWWDEIRPVIVLPADPESVEGYVEAMARAILTHQDYKPFRPIDATDRKMAHDMARAALAALLGRGKG